MDATIIDSMFRLDVSLVEKIIRPVIVYFALLIGLRLGGKRELAQLNPFDLVVLLTISNTVQNAIIGSDNSVSGGLIGAAALLGTNYIVTRFLARHQRVEEVVEGSGSELIVRGRLAENSLRREQITHADLLAAARRQGFASLDEVERAVLEPGGGISFIRKPAPDRDDVLRDIVARLERIEGALGAPGASEAHGPAGG